MAEVTNEDILETLKGVTDPISGNDLVSAGIIQGLQSKDGNVAFAIEVPAEKGGEMEPLRKEAEDKVFALPGVVSATVVLTAERAQGSSQGAAEQQQAICTSSAARVTPRNCRRHPIDRHLFERDTVDNLANVDDKELVTEAMMTGDPDIHYALNTTADTS